MHAKFQDDTLSGSEFMQRHVKIWPLHWMCRYALTTLESYYTACS